MKNNNKINIYSVSELNHEIKMSMETAFMNIWVEGEVSNYYCHNQKHLYFDLKDEYSKIKIVMFSESKKKLAFEIEDGLHLIISGYISVYEKRGEYQVIATQARPVGKGSLILAFEQLKEKLGKKGYFDDARKKPIPLLPERIGAVTSRGGAVIRDIATVLSKRFENFNLIIRNVNVQGPSSTEEICTAIDDLCEYGVDVIIIARGGGSLEDLWAFNTEQVADKIFNCGTPVISAIGHETDYTISDFVSDMRAATPSVAASIVILDKQEMQNDIRFLLGKIKNTAEVKIFNGKRELEHLTGRKIFLKPESLFLDLWQDHDSLTKELNRNTKTFIAEKKNRINDLMKDLHSNSPVSILKKGYSLLTEGKEKKIIRSIHDVKTGQDIDINLKDGVLVSKILKIIEKEIGIEV